MYITIQDIIIMDLGNLIISTNAWTYVLSHINSTIKQMKDNHKILTEQVKILT